MSSTSEPVYSPRDAVQREHEMLAPYAMRTRLSKGRMHPEQDHPYRSLYERDRDRIVHSTAFRRLMHKTQVLVTQTNDHHRTRLTHTLEVAQISRTIARQLGLNEDLTEAIALLHDLGHPPFGHAGEQALDECMADHGGFEHNRHGLRLVEVLEYRYADFPGLNLSWEVLEAQAMHSKARAAPEVTRFLSVGQPLLEAQVVDAADSLAYDAHDVDDALSVGLLAMADLDGTPCWQEAERRARAKHPALGQLQARPTIIRALIDWHVSDLLQQTRIHLSEHGIGNVDDVRNCRTILVCQSPEVIRLKANLEAFLGERVYQHARVLQMAAKGRRMLQMLFAELRQRPQLLPERYRDKARLEPVARVVCDYIAGMTDRFAQTEFARLFQPSTVM
jgi:dGTPase